MTNEQEKIVLENENLIYVVLKKYHLYNERDEYYDLGMIGLCKGAKTFDSSRNIKISTYLVRCITNEIFIYLRKKRPETISLDTDIEENLTLESVIKDNSIDIERDLIMETEIKKINEIIKSLPDNEKKLICHLYNLNGYKKMTQIELAKHFNISQTQISRTKNRVIRKIREQLKEDNKATGGNGRCF